MTNTALKRRIAALEGLIDEIEYYGLEDASPYYEELERCKRILRSRKPVYPLHLTVKLGDLVDLRVC